LTVIGKISCKYTEKNRYAQILRLAFSLSEIYFGNSLALWEKVLIFALTNIFFTNQKTKIMNKTFKKLGGGHFCSLPPCQ